MTGNKTVDKVAKVSKALLQNHWKKVEYETENIGFDWERPKESFKENFKENYKMIAIDLSKQNELDADPRAIQQINFIANLERDGNTTIFFIIEEAKETISEFSQGTVKIL